MLVVVGGGVDVAQVMGVTKMAMVRSMAGVLAAVAVAVMGCSSRPPVLVPVLDVLAAVLDVVAAVVLVLAHIVERWDHIRVLVVDVVDVDEVGVGVRVRVGNGGEDDKVCCGVCDCDDAAVLLQRFF